MWTTHVLLLLVLMFLLHHARTQESDCCSRVSGSCRSACEQMSLADIASSAAAREARLAQVRGFCPLQLETFWECLNKTLQDVLRGEEWSGRVCCPLPQSTLCQQACVTAASRRDVSQSCRLSDEVAFFSCLDHQQQGDECCSAARSAPCRDACRAVFRSQATPSVEARAAVDQACSELSPRVLTCVHNHTRATPALDPHKYMPCCEKASSIQCRDTCRRSLRTKTTGQEIVDNLQEAGCGPPMLHDQLWQCFMQSRDQAPDPKQSRIDRMGMDSAKLHCCNKASDSKCRRLCIKTFTKEWTGSWDDFNAQCLSQLSEGALIHCIDEVEEPCELGCDGLSYCSNFNNRPTELFRSCNRRADDAARNDVALWLQQGTLGLPGLSLPVLNISQCSPRAWKTVACTLQIKPCHRPSNVNWICREDCYDLLSQCIDWSRMIPGHSASSLCSHFSPDDSNAPCVSLKAFIQPSDNPHMPPQDELTLPCKGDHPCNSSEVCTVNRNCSPGRPCQMYQCVPGCKLGEVSQYMVPKNTYVSIPMLLGAKTCLKVCQCTAQGALEHCKALPCPHAENCWLGNRKIDHNSWFQIECNICSCFAGEITCSKKQCEISSLGDPDPAYTSLPCNCPPHHVPVCARNGNTYPSACLAKCAGLTDAEFEFGPCSAKDPCARHSCGKGQQCIPTRKVCLSLSHKLCPQYQCVDGTEMCSKLPYEPVCDTEGREHHNMCSFLRSWKTFAYKGPCRSNCNSKGLVCGINGVTYQSECAAHADYVSVDYTGPCVAVGQIGEQAWPQCSELGVQCPPLVRSGCLGITPPGACCPVCAGVVRFLYSQKQVERALFINKETIAALTVSAVLQALERHIQVSECVLRGYLTVEADLIVLVEARNQPPPSDLQLEACVREVEKLACLVRRSSPRVLSELSLSILTTATIVHVPATAGSIPVTVPNVGVLLPVIFVIHLYVKMTS